jgi:hypothetical protein
MTDNSLRLEAPRAEQRDAVSRVTMRLDGTDIWFESADAPLLPSVEGFASALVIPALAAGRQMVIEGAVTADWAGNAARATNLVCGWWNYPRLAPRCLSTLAPAPPPGDRGPTPVAGLAFSAGVDSFFTLHTSPYPVEALVFVHGFDMTLAETARADRVRAGLTKAASAIGARPITIRTNLKTHPLFRGVSWDRSHGGALAAVGHMLSNHIDTWLISSSYQRTLDRAWGSRWDLDPLWSGAGLSVHHIGEQYSRADKLERLAGSDLARAQLRVCWENRDDRLNCSRCGKCVRTRLLLCALGLLDQFPTLDDARSLAADLDALPGHLQRAIAHNYHFALSRPLPPDVGAATRRLLWRMRSDEWRGRLGRLARLPRAVFRQLLRGLARTEQPSSR